MHRCMQSAVSERHRQTVRTCGTKTMGSGRLSAQECKTLPSAESSGLEMAFARWRFEEGLGTKAVFVFLSVSIICMLGPLGHGDEPTPGFTSHQMFLIRVGRRARRAICRM